ncbi:cell wall-binding repeat-containing protein [Evansella sp. AB-rgal1]|uniref:cell wall-binding repeat-containing protein n=1 Tax=Evansella sp. AB-rgal1 TaxID=3242696 RepID=UPI00359E2459
MKKLFLLILLVLLPLFLLGCQNDGAHGGNTHSNTDSEQEETEGNDEEHGEGHGADHGDHHDHGHSDDAHNDFANAPSNFNENAMQNLLHHQMKNTTRLDAEDPITFSIWVSQLIWPATHEQNQPGTVILAPLENWGIALASTTLIHHPNDGPILYTENGEIPESVMNEIHRLQPKGNVNGTEVMVMGDVEEEVLAQLDGFAVEHLPGNDAIQFAVDVEQMFSEIIGEVHESVIIASIDESAKEYSIIAGQWIAHMNESVLFVTDEVPEVTRAALEKRDGNASIFVMGSEDVISASVVEELEEFGSVQRIGGSTPAEMSVEFAVFRDDATQVGWGQGEPGHGLSFASLNSPMFAIAGAPLGHLGKHTPLIWLEDEISEELYEFLASIRPTFSDNPMAGPYNHAYLFGSSEIISYRVQGILDEKLEIAGDHAH